MERKEALQGTLTDADAQWNQESGSESVLKTSESLSFLQTEKVLEKILDTSDWSLYAEGEKLEPLRFSNGKTQEEVVREVVSHIKKGVKVVFIHGACGTGKSAIALNIARKLGRASIVVPVKGLQRQYEEDYTSKKYVIKSNGEKLKIAMITGRENHDSLIKPGVSCADPFLPDTIKITEKNERMLREYYEDNPLIKHKASLEVRQMKRISVAPANPYWSPILPADFEVPLRDAKKKKYRGLSGRDFIFYHRKPGCSYYDQHLAYLDADVIIFNAAKYKIEVALDRKPETAVDIIDEADEFLDNFSAQEDLNITRLSNSFKSLYPEQPEAQKAAEAIAALLQLEEKNKQALGVDEKRIYSLTETHLSKVLSLIMKSTELQAEISLDELHYGNKLVETADLFRELVKETYVSFQRREGELWCSLVTTNLSSRFREIIDKSNALVLMSGTLHSLEVLEQVFGINAFAMVDAETSLQGTIELVKTGKELDCRYSNFTSGKHTRTEYLYALAACIQKAVKPVLVHVNAFDDLPAEEELSAFPGSELISREKLASLQEQDKTGRLISLFKAQLADMLFTTKCSRGVDFPGSLCNTIVFTKYPNPNVQSTFWKVLQKTHPQQYWRFYRDKARREFLQRLYRGLRSKEDHIFILSPDSRVLDAARELQQKSK
ncbi:DEAD/DEAH box helicase family protein [Candidatus Pacearchaeota archaeon]|nr:DEAD/DEAH box helicase family protein [Candidatus Pacearchaeota archaeon]